MVASFYFLYTENNPLILIWLIFLGTSSKSGTYIPCRGSWKTLELPILVCLLMFWKGIV